MIIDLCVIHSESLLGDLTFLASPDHASVTSYEARVRAQGSSTILATQNLGKPTPDTGNTITVNIATLLNAQAPGTYDVSVAAISASGTTDSGISNEFTVPLVAP